MYQSLCPTMLNSSGHLWMLRPHVLPKWYKQVMVVLGDQLLEDMPGCQLPSLVQNERVGWER